MELTEQEVRLATDPLGLRAGPRQLFGQPPPPRLEPVHAGSQPFDQRLGDGGRRLAELPFRRLRNALDDRPACLALHAWQGEWVRLQPSVELQETRLGLAGVDEGAVACVRGFECVVVGRLGGRAQDRGRVDRARPGDPAHQLARPFVRRDSGEPRAPRLEGDRRVDALPAGGRRGFVAPSYSQLSASRGTRPEDGQDPACRVQDRQVHLVREEFDHQMARPIVGSALRGEAQADHAFVGERLHADDDRAARQADRVRERRRRPNEDRAGGGVKLEDQRLAVEVEDRAAPLRVESECRDAPAPRRPSSSAARWRTSSESYRMTFDTLS